jgi:hypothetical protein
MRIAISMISAFSTSGSVSALRLCVYPDATPMVTALLIARVTAATVSVSTENLQEVNLLARAVIPTLR